MQTFELPLTGEMEWTPPSLSGKILIPWPCLREAAQPRSSAYQVRLKFGKQAYFMIAVERGEDSETVADKLRDLANDIAPRRK